MGGEHIRLYLRGFVEVAERDELEQKDMHAEETEGDQMERDWKEMIQK